MNINVRELLLFSTIPGIGATRLRALVSHFGETQAASRATARDLLHVEGIDRKLASSIVTFFRDSGAARAERDIEAQLSRLNTLDGQIITYWDAAYPENLKGIFDPPPFLFVRGQLDALDKYAVAIVGTRNVSAYGSATAHAFARAFSELGVPIVSGLARGVDTVAQTVSVKHGNRTIAVLGSGVDVIYPPENKALADRIIENGAVVSELMMGAKPDAGNFPRRNRIISGICLATLIVESGVEGGAMLTAYLALDQNRDVFAVPSPIDAKKKSGTNLLIKQGNAALVETIDDIIESLGQRMRPVLRKGATCAPPPPPPPLTLFEQQIYDVLASEPVHIDRISELSRSSTSDALVTLLSLEFKGLVRQLPGKMFTKQI